MRRSAASRPILAKRTLAAREKDRALKFEYALGELRESMSWYKGAKPVLGEEVTKDRRNRLEEIRRLLLAIIPRERGKTMK